MIFPLLLSLVLSGSQSNPTPHRFDGLSLSQDGKTIASFEVESQDIIKPDTHLHLVLRDANGLVMAQYDPCPTCRYSGASWSHDGRMAFIGSESKTGIAKVFILENHAVREVDQIKGLANLTQWAPDDSRLAFLAVEAAHKETGATQAGSAQVGEIGISATTDEQRIASLDPKDGKITFVSPPDTFVYEYDWQKDSSGFVATAAKGDGDNNWWTAKLEAFGLDGSTQILATPSMQIANPKVSHDGKTVYVIGGLMSDFNVFGGDVYAIPLKGGVLENRTPAFKGSITALKPTPNGLLAGAIIGGDSAILAVDDAGGSPRILRHEAISLSAVGTSSFANFAASSDGQTMAAVAQDFASAPHILYGPPQSAQAITHDNDAYKANYHAQSVSWTHDGMSVQGWLLTPDGYDPKIKHPMIAVVHGGPAAASMPRFSSSGTNNDLLKAGYFVFLPNPRGSYGQGEAFTRANMRDFGGADLGDVLAGIDEVEKIAPVDDNRLGVMGHSYGGFMTMWTVGHSNRFKAAIAGAGIANWISYYGQNGIDQWMIPFFGASAYDDPAIYQKLSPLTAIKSVKTPTFIYVGERDIECPPAQSLEFWHGLKTFNVPVSLVIYEGEGHAIRKREHTEDLTKRELAWFAKYLK